VYLTLKLRFAQDRKECLQTGGIKMAFYEPTNREREYHTGHVDQMLRAAVYSCWMALPGQERNYDELKRQMNRLIDRVIRDMKEDKEIFEA